MLLKFLLSVEINSPSTNCWNCTAVKWWQFACWTGLYSTTNLTAFWALHTNLIYNALLFLKTDWLPCASCLVTHTLGPWYNVTFSGAIINLMAYLTAWQTVHIIAVSWVLCNFYGCPKTSPHLPPSAAEPRHTVKCYITLFSDLALILTECSRCCTRVLLYSLSNKW